MSLTFAEIKKQIVKDFPEIEMLMEDQGSRSAQYFRIKDFGCNCLEMNEYIIGVYLTVAPGYCISYRHTKCKIMYEDAFCDSFAKLNAFHKNDLKKGCWTYEDLKRSVRKMLDFQKKVNSYISLLNYKTCVEGVKEIVINMNEVWRENND